MLEDTWAIEAVGRVDAPGVVAWKAEVATLGSGREAQRFPRSRRGGFAAQVVSRGHIFTGKGDELQDIPAMELRKVMFHLRLWRGYASMICAIDWNIIYVLK